MAVSGELSFYTDSIRTGLLGSSLKNTSDLPAILSAFARYRSGAPSEGMGINHLLSAPRAQWYGGQDTLRSQDQTARVNRHYAFWTNMMIPISIDFLNLTKITNITGAQFLDPSFSLNKLDQKGKEAYFSNLQVAYQAAMYGGQLDYDRSLWGNLQEGDNVDRAPESLGDIFNEAGELHGLTPERLGKFDSRHALGRSATKFPQWEYVHKPRVYYFNSTDGLGTKPPDGTAAFKLTRENVFEAFDNFLRPWDLIVKGLKLLPLSHEVFSLIATNKDFIQSDKFPMVIYDGMGWEHTIQCVRMHNTLMFADSDAKSDELWGIHVGSPGMDNGTFFPLFWEDDFNMSARNKLGEIIRKQGRERPMHAPVGPTRPIPWYTDEMFRFTGKADSGGTNLRLMYMFVCTERWCQTKGVGFTV